MHPSSIFNVTLHRLFSAGPSYLFLNILSSNTTRTPWLRKRGAWRRAVLMTRLQNMRASALSVQATTLSRKTMSRIWTVAQRASLANRQAKRPIHLNCKLLKRLPISETRVTSNPATRSPETREPVALYQHRLLCKYNRVLRLLRVPNDDQTAGSKMTIGATSSLWSLAGRTTPSTSIAYSS